LISTSDGTTCHKEQVKQPHRARLQAEVVCERQKRHGELANRRESDSNFELRLASYGRSRVERRDVTKGRIRLVARQRRWLNGIRRWNPHRPVKNDVKAPNETKEVGRFIDVVKERASVALDQSEETDSKGETGDKSSDLSLASSSVEGESSGSSRAGTVGPSLQSLGGQQGVNDLQSTP
jgi:hypothetical protein